MASLTRSTGRQVTDLDANYVTDRATSARIPLFRRISWGAVLAGAAIAFITQIALNALGLAIGAVSIDPQTTASPTVPEFTTGATIWMATSMIISMFLGGVVAGRMSGTFNETEGTISGLTAWAVVTFITIIALTSTLVSVIGGLTNALQSSANLVAQGAASISPEIADAVEELDIARQSVREDVRMLLADVDDDPQGIAEDGEVSAVEQQVNLSLDQLFRLGIDAADDAQRQDIVNTLEANTDLTQEEIRQQINEWEQEFQQVTNDVEATIEAGLEDFAEATSAAAGVVFALIIAGAAAAAAGGYIGTPDLSDMMDESREEIADAA